MVVADIPGTYLLTYMDKYIVMVIQGGLYYILTIIDPSLYWEFGLMGDTRKLNP